MPYTIYCKQTERQPQMCMGVFESDQLADRHARRHVRSRNYQIVPIEEPLVPENYLSLERITNAANFALTVLQNVDKAQQEKYMDKCVEELKEALNDNPPPEPTRWQWEVIMNGSSQPQVGVGVDEEAALLNLGFPIQIARDWQQHCARIRRLREAA